MGSPLPWNRKDLYALWGRIDSGVFLFNRVNRLPLRLTYLLATLLLFAIVAADYYSHIELMLSPFYALPCLLVDWRIGRLPALAYGLFASAIQCVIGTFGGHPYSNDLFFYFDIGVNVLFYGVLIWLVAKLKVALEMERVLSRVDFLTKFANRRTFLEALDIEYGRCQRYGHNFTLVLVDCDDFSGVIDAHGYSTGDMLLGAVAELLTNSFRTTDFMARTGTNEFALILPETLHKYSEIKLRKVHAQLEMLALARGWPVTFSIACVVCARVPESASGVLNAANQLMAHIKGTGKNRVEQEIRGFDEIPPSTLSTAK